MDLDRKLGHGSTGHCCDKNCLTFSAVVPSCIVQADHNASRRFPPTDVFDQTRNNQFDKEGYIIFHAFQNIQQTFNPCATPNKRNDTHFGLDFFASEFQARHLNLRPSTNAENIRKGTSFIPS
jgi:hypothetical protein